MLCDKEGSGLMSESKIIVQPVLTDEEADRRVKAAVKFAIDKQEAIGVPVPRYDRKNGYIYIVDKISGKRTVLRKISDRRRFSERRRDGKKT